MAMKSYIESILDFSYILRNIFELFSENKVNGLFTKGIEMTNKLGERYEYHWRFEGCEMRRASSSAVVG